MFRLAKDARVGDCLYNIKGEEVVITSISKKKYIGVIAPLSNSGTLVVNGFLVSCYAYPNHDRAHAALKPLRIYKSNISNSVEV